MRRDLFARTFSDTAQARRSRPNSLNFTNDDQHHVAKLNKTYLSGDVAEGFLLQMDFPLYVATNQEDRTNIAITPSDRVRLDDLPPGLDRTWQLY